MNRERGREQGEGRRREGNAQTWRGGDSGESQAPLTASGRERGKGKAGREQWEGNIHNREHIICTALNLTYARNLGLMYAREGKRLCR